MPFESVANNDRRLAGGATGVGQGLVIGRDRGDQGQKNPGQYMGKVCGTLSQNGRGGKEVVHFRLECEKDSKGWS